MKRHYLILILFSIASVAWCMGDKETRNLSSFDELSVSAGIKATLVKSSTNKIEIEVEGIELDKVITEVDGDRLEVKIKSNWFGSWGRNRKVEVVISYSEALNYISVSSGASLNSEEVVRTASKLDINSSSGAYSKLRIDGSEISVDVSSGASIHLQGSTSDLDVDVSSGSTFKGYDLKAESVTVEVSSGGSAQVYASKSLNADVSSGGSVRYKGNPSQTNIDQNSGGSVKPAN